MPQSENLPSPQPHCVAASVILHLLPGISTLLFHIAIVDWVVSAGLPTSFSWNVLSNILWFHPLLFGTLIYIAKKRGNSGFSLEGVVAYRATLPIRKYLMWAILIILATAPLWFALAPLGEYLQSFFGWIPRTDEAYEGNTSMSIIAITFALNFLLTAFITPIAEELYYRGYLLPRMPAAFGKAGPVVHSFLFALQHVHSPWLLITRTISLLPLIYVARLTKSVLPGILAHCFVNSYSLLEWASSRWQ